MGAIMVPQVLAVIQVIFPARGADQGAGRVRVTAGLGTVSGPLIGGLLIQHNLLGLGWRPIFLINVPVGIIAVCGLGGAGPRVPAPSPPRLDPVGVGLVSAALLLLLYPLVQGRQLGWPAWTFVSMAASAPVFACSSGGSGSRSAGTAPRWCRCGLFGERGFSAGMAIAMTFFIGIASFGLVLTLFLQLGLGFTPLHRRG
jgi:MFS family permease